MGIRPLLQFHHPLKAGPDLVTLLFFPLVPSSWQLLHGSRYSFPLVRYSCPLSADGLYAFLCVKVYSWCIREERCTPCPPPVPPSCSPRPFLYSSVYSCHLFLISPASSRSLLFLPYIVHFLAWNNPFISPVLLKRSLDFPILLSFISLHCSFKKAFSSHYSLEAFSGYVFPFLLHLSLLFFVSQTKLCEPLTWFMLYSKVKLVCYSRYLLISYFCIPIPSDEKGIFFDVTSRRCCRSS